MEHSSDIWKVWLIVNCLSLTYIFDIVKHMEAKCDKLGEDGEVGPTNGSWSQACINSALHLVHKPSIRVNNPRSQRVTAVKPFEDAVIGCRRIFMHLLLSLPHPGAHLRHILLLVSGPLAVHLILQVHRDFCHVSALLVESFVLGFKVHPFFFKLSFLVCFLYNHLNVLNSLTLFYRG